MKKYLPFIFIIIFVAGITLNNNSNFPFSAAAQNVETNLLQAFNNRQSNVQVQGKGIISRILPDDLKGSRHQRFILKLKSQPSLLIAHNIGLASRINNLSKGDSIEFYGEYEWNTKGGVVHWTHLDPKGKHINGWLKHKGKTYQ